MGTSEVFEVLKWLPAWLMTLVGLLALVGRGPAFLNGWWQRTAKQTVEHDQRERALTVLAANVTEIMAQLQPNGGASLRDAVDRLRAGQDHAERLLGQHIEYAREADANIRDRMERIDARLEDGDHQFAEIRVTLRALVEKTEAA